MTQNDLSDKNGLMIRYDSDQVLTEDIIARIRHHQAEVELGGGGLEPQVCERNCKGIGNFCFVAS